jgi:hypothetical protein
MTDARTSAAPAGVCDEQQLLHDASAAFTKADAPGDLDAVWRSYVQPVWDSIDGETQDILSRLYALRLSTMSWDHP